MMKKIIVIIIMLLCSWGTLTANSIIIIPEDNIICTTMDLKTEYEVVGIYQGFTIDMLQTLAIKLNCDAVIGIRMVLPNTKGVKYPFLYYGTFVRFVKLG